LKWTRLAEEAEVLCAKIKSREVAWPPSAPSSSPLKASPSAVARVDPMSPAVAAELPSMRALLGTAIGRLAAGSGPPDARAQQQFVHSLLATYHGLLVWREHSRHVLRVNATLFEDFAHGQPATIKGTELHLPVPALYIEFPRGITMLDPLDETKRLNVRGAFLSTEHEDGDEYSRRELRVAVVGKRKQRWPTGVDPLITFRLALDNRSLQRPKVLPERVAELVHVPEELTMSLRAKEDPTRRDLGRAAPNSIVLILVRLLDYLMSTPDDVRRITRWGHRSGEGSGHTASAPYTTTSTYWSVGGRHARSAHAGFWRKGKPLAYLVHVRAHFRNQAWGPGHTLRRRKKIRRHERGPHGGATHTTIQRLTRPARD
jgi:hypothetical protein